MPLDFVSGGRQRLSEELERMAPVVRRIVVPCLGQWGAGPADQEDPHLLLPTGVPDAEMALHPGRQYAGLFGKLPERGPSGDSPSSIVHLTS